MNEFVLTGDLITMDPDRPRAEAMAVRDGRILAVGSRDEALSALPGAAVCGAPGTVVPGLIDAHVHTLIAGLELRRLDVSDARSVREIVARIGAHLDGRGSTNGAAAQANGTSASDWLVVAAHVQAEELAEKRLPTRADLDPVTKGRPVFLDRRTHDAIANSAALARAEIDALTPDPVGGEIERDADGVPTGVLIERPAAELVWSQVPAISEADRRTALREIQPSFHALGIVGAAEPGLTAAEIGTYQAAHADGELALRTWAMPLADTDLPVEELLAGFRGTGVRTGFGDEWLRVGGVKVYLDGTGSFGSALLREPWPGTDGYLGNQTAPTETFRAIARFCARERWSLAIHTVGGAAIDLALDAFAEANEVAPIAPLRFSVMHAYLWPSEENFRRARELGVLASIQPGMQWRVAGSLASRFGVEGAAKASPLRSWLDGGVEVAGGSDGPDFPQAPLFGMYQARSRAAQGFEGPLGPEEAIDGERALRMWTTSAARYVFAERERGALRPGFLADWAALAVDPVESEPEALRDAAVLQTGVGGRVVHEA
ncbi:MAG TPA: amidohydrolase [Solirubrobacterales bacterium]|nr:amidohydrolase [Solirubrobacterales bacterium]